MQVFPRLSVVIVGKNNANFLEACLDSVFQQSYPAFDVIYLDDGSTDETWSRLTNYAQKHSNLKPLQTSGLGISKARNQANRAASGDYIVILDSDDSLLEGALQAYATLLQNTKIDMLYGDSLYVSETGRIFGLRRYPEFLSNQHFARSIMGNPQVPFKHSALLYRKSLAERFGGYDESLPQKVDIELVLRYLLSNDLTVGKVPHTICRHVKHSRQISQNRLRSLRIWIRIIRRYEKNPLLRHLLIGFRCLAELSKFLVEFIYSR